jgi:ATP synthase protein I
MSRRDDQHPDPSKRDDFERRLNAKLEAQKEANAEQKPSGWSQGIKYGSEFIGGVLTGAGLGFLADWFFGTTPWGLFIGVFVGFAAGTLNVVRAAQDLNRDTGPNGSDGADQG